MSQLEGAAQPSLLRMMRNPDGDVFRHDRSVFFDESLRRALAAWIAKTALVCGAKFEPALPSQFYEQMYRDQAPSVTTRVWLAATSQPFQHYLDFRPLYVHAVDDVPPSLPNAYSAVVSMGFMAGFVVSWLDRVPNRRELLRDFGRMLVPLWPIHVGATCWPSSGGRLDLVGLDALSDAIVAAPKVVGVDVS